MQYETNQLWTPFVRNFFIPHSELFMSSKVIRAFQVNKSELTDHRGIRRVALSLFLYDRSIAASGFFCVFVVSHLVVPTSCSPEITSYVGIKRCVSSLPSGKYLPASFYHCNCKS